MVMVIKGTITEERGDSADRSPSLQITDSLILNRSSSGVDGTCNCCCRRLHSALFHDDDDDDVVDDVN